MNHTFDQAAALVADELVSSLQQVEDRYKDHVQQIRLRVNRPVMLQMGSGIGFVTLTGQVVDAPTEACLLAVPPIMEESFKKLCQYSVHSHTDEIKQGFISLPGGHRAGICGVGVHQGGQVVGQRDITSINLRIARQIQGAADTLLARMAGMPLKGILVSGAPSSGKTTLLRDLARQFSQGYMGEYRQVAVIDERGELGSVHRGVPQNDLGYCDILSGYPKGAGIMLAVRTMAPQIIICDEVGGLEEIRAVESTLNSGVVVIASIHAGSLEELWNRPQARQLLDSGAFGTIVQLSGRVPGHIADIVAVGGEQDDQNDGSCIDCCGVLGDRLALVH